MNTGAEIDMFIGSQRVVPKLREIKSPIKGLDSQYINKEFTEGQLNCHLFAVNPAYARNNTLQLLSLSLSLSPTKMPFISPSFEL